MNIIELKLNEISVISGGCENNNLLLGTGVVITLLLGTIMGVLGSIMSIGL